MKHHDAGKEAADEIFRKALQTPRRSMDVFNRPVTGVANPSQTIRSRAEFIGVQQRYPLKAFGFFYYGYDHGHPEIDYIYPSAGVITFPAVDPDPPVVVTISAGAVSTVMKKGYNFAEVWEPFLKNLSAGRDAAWGIAPWSPGTASPQDVTVDDIQYDFTDATEVRYFTDSAATTRNANGTYVQLCGRTLFEVIAKFDIAVINNPHLNHLKLIENLSSGKTKVLMGFMNFESINQGTPTVNDPFYDNVLWNNSYFDEVSTGYILDAKTGSGCSGSDINAYACTTIDKYEGVDSGDETAWPRCDVTSGWDETNVACPHTPPHDSKIPLIDKRVTATSHTWDCDVWDSAYVAAYTDGIAGEVLDKAYDGTRDKTMISGLLFDNVFFEPYFGQATTSPIDSGSTPPRTVVAYSAAWTSCLAATKLNTRDLAGVSDPDYWVWANTSSTVDPEGLTAYSQAAIKNRFVEQFFLADNGTDAVTKTTIISRLEESILHDTRIVIGVLGTYADQDLWATGSGGTDAETNGTWADIVAFVQARECYGNVYTMPIRQTPNGGWCYWQQGFLPL